MTTIRSYRDLEVWQRAMELSRSVYSVTSRFPREELYGITSQMRRAAVSVPSNVAEGHARCSTKEFLHHLSMALGSLAELETQLILSESLGFVTPDDLNKLLSDSDALGKRMRSLMESLRKRVSRN
jgi:four helix bundle protein